MKGVQPMPDRTREISFPNYGDAVQRKSNWDLPGDEAPCATKLDGTSGGQTVHEGAPGQGSWVESTDGGVCKDDREQDSDTEWNKGQRSEISGVER